MTEKLSEAQHKLEKLEISSSNSQDLFVIKHIPGKGKGLVAAKLIPANTLILAESPLLKIEDEIDEKTEISQVISAFEQLTHSSQEAYLFLSGYASSIYQSQPSWKVLSPKHQKAIAIWGGNNWNDMVFVIGCRINHACVPNLETAWNERLGKQTWTTVREVHEGEEFTGTYIYDIVSHGTKYRREELKSHWGFDCTCEACENRQDVIEGRVEKKD